jgi:hypothetical protein
LNRRGAKIAKKSSSYLNRQGAKIAKETPFTIDGFFEERA